MAKTKRLALMALLTAIALTIFVIENQIPAPVPIPGVKLGLSNIITLVAMVLLSRREAGAVLLVRILMGAMFLTIGLFPEKQLWVVSALAGVAHNAGQLLACVLVVKTPGVLAYAPILAASGVITGVFTGLAAMYLLRALKKTKL